MQKQLVNQEYVKIFYNIFFIINLYVQICSDKNNSHDDRIRMKIYLI